MNEWEAQETENIIEELTRPHPRQHCYARITADMRLTMKRYLENHPEIINDPQSELVIDQIIAHAGSIIDLLDDYEISYREGVDYAIRPTNRRDSAIPPKLYGGDSSNSNSDSNTGNANANAPKRPTATRRTNEYTVDDSRRVADVPIASDRKAKQPERPRRANTERHPAARGESFPGHELED